MNPPVLAPPLAGNVIGADSGAFVIAEWKDAGGPPGPPRLIAPWHVHYSGDEAWYVLEGVLRIHVGSEEVEARAGSCVFVKAGTPHTYWNPGPGLARYLLIMSTNIHRLIQDIHAAKDRSPEALRVLFKKHDSDLIDPIAPS